MESVSDGTRVYSEELFGMSDRGGYGGLEGWTEDEIEGSTEVADGGREGGRGCDSFLPWLRWFS